MKNLNYQPIVYESGMYDIKCSIRKRINLKTDNFLRRRQRGFVRETSKTELMIKLGLIITIIGLIAFL